MPYASLPASDSSGVLAGSAYDRKVNEMQASLNLLGLKQSRSENIDQLTAALLVRSYLHRALPHRPALLSAYPEYMSLTLCSSLLMIMSWPSWRRPMRTT